MELGLSLLQHELLTHEGQLSEIRQTEVYRMLE